MSKIGQQRTVSSDRFPIIFSLFYKLNLLLKNLFHPLAKSTTKLLQTVFFVDLDQLFNLKSMKKNTLLCSIWKKRCLLYIILIGLVSIRKRVCENLAKIKHYDGCYIFILRWFNSIIIIKGRMKIHQFKKIKQKTDLKFFTASQFKQRQNRTAENSKNKSKRAINSTFSNFKQHLLHQEAEMARSYSKQSKPIVQKLNLAENLKNQTFKIPQAVSKRSTIKSITDLKEIVKDGRNMFKQSLDFLPKPQQKEAQACGLNDRYTSRTFQDFRKRKYISVNNKIKQKLEISALQKFKDIILKENSQNQNIVSQENAEALYIMLQTNRKKLQQNKHNNLKVVLCQPDKMHDKEIRNIQNNTITGKYKESSEIRHDNPRSTKTIDQQILPDKRYPQMPDHKKQIKPAEKNYSNKELAKNGEAPEMKEGSNKNEVTQKNDFKQGQGSQANSQSQNIKSLTKVYHEKELQKETKIELKRPPILSFSPKNKPQNVFEKKITQKIFDDQKQSIQDKKLQTQGQQFKIEFQMKKQNLELLRGIPSATVIPKQKSMQKIKAEATNIQKHRQFANFLQKQDNYKQPITFMPTKQKEVTIKGVQNNIPQKTKQKFKSEVDQDDELEEINFKGNKMSEKQIKVEVNQAQLEPSNHGNEKERQSNDQIFKNSQDDDQIIDQALFYLDRIDDIGQYRIKSKDTYNDKEAAKQLIQINKICSYYLAHQFLYYTKRTLDIFQGNKKGPYFSIEQEEVQRIIQEGALVEEIEQIEQHLEQGKKLVKKAYEDCKLFLKSEERVLVIDHKNNYHLKCCSGLIKEFKLIYEIFQKMQNNLEVKRRCVYIIEMFGILKMLNGEQFKSDYEQYESIEDPVAHIAKYKSFLIGE